MSNEKKTKKVYRDGLSEIKNPVDSVFGKIIIWILVILMVAGTAYGLIQALINLGQ
jgi:succinate dehydrogenase/fumarate reductase cytochrome b subunit